ncbi:MAG: hypothetical protein JRD04_12285 [Deltaproteobacteria bacterium]|nr:hypothetical protein [Deltaproteobacteria bacterium]
MQHALRNTIALLGILALLAGCSFSYSSGASSDSSGASSDSSKSSSASSGASESDPKDAKKSFIGDVSAYTTSAAKSGDAQDYLRELGRIAEQHGDYLRELGRIAEQHGITDWERDTATYNAIGTGLRRAGISRDEVKNVYFIQDLAAKEKNALVLILESYQP